VAKRPVEQFETQAPMPDWQLEPDEENWGFNMEESAPLVDADGNPIGTQPRDPLAPEQQQPAQPQDGSQVDQQWLDEVLKRNPENRPPPAQRVPPPAQRVPPPRQPPPQPSQPPADPLQPRP